MTTSLAKKKSPHGGPRDGAGAKPIHATAMRRVNVLLDDLTVDQARTLGNGNVSAGLREAVRKTHKKVTP